MDSDTRTLSACAREDAAREKIREALVGHRIESVEWPEFGGVLLKTADGLVVLLGQTRARRGAA